MAREVLLSLRMKPRDPDRNQGEGNRDAARRYNRDLREFISEGNVEPAAHDAKESVERDPKAGERAEAAARRGPRGTHASIDELVAKGRTVVDRVRPVVARVAARVRARLSRK